MPLEQRVISPIGVGRGCVPMDSAGNLAINIPNELECVTNGTLANIIRQLSSLSRYAEDLFASILDNASLLIVRSNGLQSRIQRLNQKVVNLDSGLEEVSLQDIHLRKAFKSNQQFDQQVVNRDSIPESIQEVYSRCLPPPPLHKLNAFRDDGKDGLKFYTDPNYFFELWRQEMLDQTERVLADKQVKKVPKKQTNNVSKRKVRQPANTRERYRQMMTNNGEFIIETNARPNSLEVDNFYRQSVQQLNHYNSQERQPRRQQSITSRPSQPPPAPPSNPPSGPSTPSHRVRETLPPPPPPPPMEDKTNIPVVEPPPPPPPPPSGETKERVLPTISDLKSIQLKPTQQMAPKTDARSDLLQAIREGIQLKRVEDCKQREVEKTTPLHDVASILARRVAIELSDSEGAQDDDDDSDAWDDESEC